MNLSKRATLAVMLVAWLGFWAAHAWFAADAFAAEQAAHGQPWDTAEFVVEWLRQTFENVQSEAWQVLFAYVIQGMAQDRKIEGIDRKLDAVLGTIARYNNASPEAWRDGGDA